MAAKPLTQEQAQEAIAILNAHSGNITLAAASIKMHPATFRNRILAARKFGIEPAAPVLKPSIEVVDQDKMKDRIFELETALKAVRKDTLTDQWVKRKIIGLNEEIVGAEPPEWLLEIPRGIALPGVPTAFWSDWHWGEVVFPNQVNGVNEFNLEIAHRRAKSLVQKTIYLLKQHIVNPNYPGIVLALGGDMMSGDIHEELSESNEIPQMPCLIDLYGVLVWAIKTLADEFGAVFVPCVTGNHGRNTKRFRAKGRNFSNFDWLLYQFLDKAFEGDERVTFFIPDGPDACYSVVGHKYLMTHGDQFRGGDGMIGHFGPVLRGEKKKQSRNANIGLEFDTMIHGHFHTYFPTDGIIGNGSLKGLDEYAFQGNFGYEPPQQALWLTHPQHGITIQMAVKLETPAGKLVDTGADWVSWHKQ